MKRVTITGFASPSGPRAGAPTSIVLDPSQERVSEASRQGHVAVVGAPGTGKTTALVEAVATALAEERVAPEELVVIAASRRAATALRDDIARRIARPTDGALARTLASLAFQAVTQAARSRGEEPPRLLTGAEQDAMLAEIERGHRDDGTGLVWPAALGPEVRELAGFRTELRELYMRVVEAGGGAEELRRAGIDAEIVEWQAAGTFLAEYTRVLDGLPERYLDAAELLAEARRAVRDGEALQGVRLLVVDDLQEQGPAALAFLRALVEAGTRIIAAGDPDAAAATFRGSEPGAIARLGEVLGAAVDTITLAVRYRQGPVLSALAAQIAERIGTAGAGAQRRATPAETRAGARGDEVRVLTAESPATLHRTLARELRRQRLIDGVPWSKMAVVVRSGTSGPSLARALALADVPVHGAVQARPPQDEAAARDLLRAAAVAVGADELDADTAAELLAGPVGGLDGLALRRLRLALRHEELRAGGNRTPGELLVDALGAPGGFATVDSAAARRGERLARSLHAAGQIARDGGSIEEVLWRIWEDSRLESLLGTQSEGSGLLAEEAHRQLDGVVALFTAAKRAVERAPEAPPSEFIAHTREAALREDSLAPRSAEDAVWIGTPNTVLGEEYELVIVTGLQEGAWPNPQLRGSLLYPQEYSARAAGVPVGDVDERRGVLHDELRLFYLACTRARDTLILAAVSGEDESPSPFLRFPALPTPEVADAGAGDFTLRGLVGQLRRAVVAGDADAARALAVLAGEGVPGADPEEWYGLHEPSTEEPLVDLSDPEARVSVSPSRIEGFEDSPMVWFIDSVSEAPAALPNAIGTIVHAAMEACIDVDDPERLTAEALWEYVDARWSELRFDAPWLEERQRVQVDGLLVGLSEYLQEFAAAGHRAVGAEDRFRLDLTPARLVGSIDRVEILADGEVRIVDLKTGRTAPTAAQLREHAQLSAYQLAAERGAIAELPDDAEGASGALLYVGHTARGRHFKLLSQEPLDAERTAAFIRRVEAAAHGMAAARFEARTDHAATDPQSAFVYRMHIVPAVSADQGRHS